jgi:signal peptidase I
MFSRGAWIFRRFVHHALICLLVACIGLEAGCGTIPGHPPQADQEPLTIFQQLARLEVSSDHLYQAIASQADAEGFSRRLELQSDLAGPLTSADLERLTQSFKRTLKVMLFDLAPADFWERHLAEYYAGALSLNEARTLIVEYEHQILHSSSPVQVLRQSFVTDRLPDLLPVIRAWSQTLEISNGAMVPTFLPGDHVIVHRTAYHAAGPQRGDVVLYRYPDEKGKRFVHRVIGLPGDRIEIRTQSLSVNGEVVTEPYVQHTDQPLEPGNVRDHIGPMTVPPEAYFVLGDNREESLDSRFLGSISKSHVLGQVVLIHWSVDSSTRSPRWERLNQPVH